MAEEKRYTIEQHEHLRVPQGWTGQDRAMVIQLERIHDQIYARIRNAVHMANIFTVVDGKVCITYRRTE